MTGRQIDTIKILGNIEDTRLKIVHGTHAGVSAARTLRLRKARGDLITFLDSGDELLPTKIEAAVAAFKSNPNAVMVYSY